MCIRDRAEGVLAKLTAGADFATLAKEVSEDKGSAARGGEIPGWIERDKTVPPFEKAAFALKPGELSRVIRTRYGLHIIKLLEYRKAEPVSYTHLRAHETVLDLVCRLLLEKKQNNKHKQNLFSARTPTSNSYTTYYDILCTVRV